MGLYFNTTFVFCIAFLMIFTYAAEYAVFSEKQDFDDSLKSSSTPALFDKTTFINVAFNFSREILQHHMVGPVFVMPKGTAKSFELFITSMQKIPNVFNRFQTGMQMYNALPLKTGGIVGYTVEKSEIDDLFIRYLKEKGYEITSAGTILPLKKNILQQALDLLGKIPEGIGRFLELLTFSIKDHYGNNIIPEPVMWILNIFFIPLGIILIIEILPIIIKAVEAIGSLLDAFTPFT